MFEHRRFVGLLTRFVKPARLNLPAPLLAFALLVSVAPRAALAGPKDSSATKLANAAMQTDYMGTQFKKAEQKLKKALQQCGDSACSYDVVARLHRDLATVYIGGLNQASKGKAELKLALAANPDLQLDNDLATPELKKAFKEAGGHGPKAAADDAEDAEEKPAKRDRSQPKEGDCTPGSDGCDAEAPAQAAAPVDSAPNRVRKNWLSLNFEQDFLVYTAADNVCASYNGSTGSPQYACFQGGQQYGYTSTQQTIYGGAGNHVGSGVGVSTSRLLLGFDRLVSSNFSVGARLGFAFGGGPTTFSGAKFLPLHAELRGNYWFGTDPFASSGVRPYVGVSVGLAELDGHVSVEYYKDEPGYNSNSRGTLDAWRRTGKTFAGLGFGMMIPVAGSSGIVPEVRVMEMLGAASLAFNATLGYAYGF